MTFFLFFLLNYSIPKILFLVSFLHVKKFCYKLGKGSLRSHSLSLSGLHLLTSLQFFCCLHTILFYTKLPVEDCTVGNYPKVIISWCEVIGNKDANMWEKSIWNYFKNLWETNDYTSLFVIQSILQFVATTRGQSGGIQSN